MILVEYQVWIELPLQNLRLLAGRLGPSHSARNFLVAPSEPLASDCLDRLHQTFIKPSSNLYQTSTKPLPAWDFLVKFKTMKPKTSEKRKLIKLIKIRSEIRTISFGSVSLTFSESLLACDFQAEAIRIWWMGTLKQLQISLLYWFPLRLGFLSVLTLDSLP